MTPLKLSICLHYHSSCEDMAWATGASPIAPETVKDLLDDGLLRLQPTASLMRYGPTMKLHAFVEMLCATPLPETAWIDPRTRGFVSK